MKRIILSLVAMIAISVPVFAQTETVLAPVVANPVSVENVTYHVLFDGPKNFEDRGWSFTFSKTNFSSVGFTVGGATDYKVLATTRDGLRTEYDLREVMGSNYDTHVYEHSISVRTYAGSPHK